MRKLILPLIGAFIISAIYMLPDSRESRHRHTEERNVRGGGDDEEGLAAYELMLLKDPATGRIPDHIREKEMAYASTLPNDLGTTLSSSLYRTTSMVSWQPRGPWNVGGKTRAFGVDINNENNLIAGTTSGQMWRSTDQGLTWHETTPVNAYQGASYVIQDIRHGHTNVWYYCTGEAYNSAEATGAYYYGNGIYKSVDSGQTWTVLDSTVTASITTDNFWSELVWTLKTNPADTVNDVVYAAAVGGLYKSMNGGVSWRYLMGSGSFYTDVAVSSRGVVYASFSSDGSGKGIYRSTDGVTFTNITPAGFPGGYNRIKIGINPTDESQVYFLTNNTSTGFADTNYVGQIEYDGLWKYNYLSGTGSGTGGLWHDYSLNMPNTGGYFNTYNCQGSYDMIVMVKPDDSNTVFIGGTNLYRSTSGFADNTHTAMIGGYVIGASLPIVNEYPNHHPDQHNLVFLPSDPKKLFSANDGGMFITNNDTAASVSWTSLDNGYLSTMFYTCAIDHATTDSVIIGGAQDNGSWYVSSGLLHAPWVMPRGGDGTFCAIADSGKAFYFSIQNCRMMKAKLSASGVVDSYARIDPIGGHAYLFVNPFTLDPNNSNIMYLASGRALWRNSDLSGIPYAQNWDTISTNWTKFNDSVPTSNTHITAITVCKVPANRVYYGTDYRQLYRKDGANVGSPASVSIASSLFPPGGNVSSIAADPTNGDHLLVAFSNYSVYSLFYSPDAGVTWHKVAGNLEQTSTGAGNGPSVRWVRIIPVTDGYVYLAGTSTGLYAATSLDTTSADATVWVQQGAGTIGAAVVDMIDYRSTDGLVVIATHSKGMFSTYINSIANVLSVPAVATSQFDLNFTNYPNPFTDMTTIQFNIKERSHVALNVYDVQGRLVTTLANEEMEAGEKKFSFQRNLLASGTYYCTLTANGHTETRKLVLLW